MTSMADDGIPHGLEGYRQYGCDCDDGTAKSCKGANRLYHRQQRLKRKLAAEAVKEADELAPKRARKTSAPRRTSTESDDSVPAPKRGRRPGLMEQAVMDECATLEASATRPTVVVAARNLARMVDDLSGTTKSAAVQVSTTKQIMAMIESLRPKESGSKRKSGGRLATVGSLTKVRRSGTA